MYNAAINELNSRKRLEEKAEKKTEEVNNQHTQMQYINVGGIVFFTTFAPILKKRDGFSEKSLEGVDENIPVKMVGWQKRGSLKKESIDSCEFLRKI